MALLVAAVTAVLVPAPTALTAPLAAVAVVATVEPIVRTRRVGHLDALVVGTGSVLISLMALGLLLNYLPGGITERSWGIAAGLAGLAALLGSELHHRFGAARTGAAARTAAKTRTATGTGAAAAAAAGWRAVRESVRAGGRALTPRRLLGASWFVAAALVVTVALTMSVRATQRAEQPPLSLAVAAPASGQAAAPGTAVIAVSATRPAGPYRLFVDAGQGSVLLRPSLAVTSGQTYVTVPAPDGRRVVVTLTGLADDHVLRSLVLGARQADPARPAPGTEPSR
ncbi:MULTISPECIES: hypothetical protein [Frankia]|uniref:hypothetical protein n=1 Tax=Frankia TaxID=1854 RepID=UPI000FF89990|nr:MULTISPECIES: hypothetical protein [Frankia]